MTDSPPSSKNVDPATDLDRRSPADRHSLWPHRLAVALVCVTFPLIWAGGLVTTYDAGMAVPDWPSTYGYNMFLYPWQTWLYGPWDLFVEHGHRLLGALAGMVTIGLVVTTFAADQRTWVRVCSVLALVLVIAQGSLGGMRVLLDDRTLALIHGCVGPAFFSFAVAIAVFTSRSWAEVCRAEASSTPAALARAAAITSLLAFIQLIAGANLRHIEPTASPSVFRVVVWAHLILAALILAHGVMVAWRARRLPGRYDQAASLDRAPRSVIGRLQADNLAGGLESRAASG